MNRLLTVGSSGGRPEWAGKRGMVSGLGRRQAVMAVANMVESLLRGSGQAAVTPTAKITASHLSRLAIVYVRQSTLAQVRDQHRVDPAAVRAGRDRRRTRLAGRADRRGRRRPGRVRTVRRRTRRLPADRRPDVHGRGRGGVRAGGVPAGAVQRRPDPADGVGPADRHAAHRHRRRLRPGQRQRPDPARAQGPDVGDRAALPAGPVARGEARCGQPR